MSKLSKKKLSSIILSGVILLVVLSCLAIYYLGYVTVTFKQSDDKVVVVQNICGDKIDSYNSLVDKSDNTNLAKLVKELDGREASTKDATCLFMIAQGSVFVGDKTKTELALQQLKDTQENGTYASGKIKGLTSIGTLERMQEFLNLPNEPVEALGAG